MSLDDQTPDLGATYLGEGRCRFVVWAPFCETVELHLVAPTDRVVRMARVERGYHEAVVDGVEPGARYFYRLNGEKERPDPASRYQPEGVHGPSEVVDPGAFVWKDGCWFGRPLRDFVVYELHVGAFTPEGTFDSVTGHLDDLKELGVTAVELMPVAQFPGTRNWGYDGVYPFAVQASYGGPVGLNRLVDACHQQGLSVVLDVVYNHLGPEGNYLGDFGPYFTERYLTPWGAAINFDGPGSDEVRRFFIENALYWLTEFHVDALRLDAIHATRDASASPFLEELGAAVHRQGEALNRRLIVIAESDANDARVIRARAIGGYGLDAQWSDDFHHALHALLTGERTGYYQDFGRVADLAKALREGFVYTGQYSRFRGRRHGNSPRLNDARQFVVCTQNHDQVGNRMLGERLSSLVSFDALKLAAGVLLLSPFVPLLFMGEEYGETAPFQYFTSHSDPALIDAVRRGRREEFAAFAWHGDVPDPDVEATFLRSRPQHGLRNEKHHRVLLDFYQELLRLRRSLPPLAELSKESLEVIPYEHERALFLRRWSGMHEVFAAFNFAAAAASLALPPLGGCWRKRLDSSEVRWLGAGTTVPGLLDGANTITLTLPSYAVALFARTQGAG